MLALHQHISWIFNCLRKADINCDRKMSPEEVKSFLHDINIEVDNEYVKLLFEVIYLFVGFVYFEIKVKMNWPYTRWTPCWFCVLEDSLVFPLLQKCDQSKTGLLEGKEIKHFYEILTDREEIDVIYKTYAETEGLMSAANLLDFLVKEQKEKVDLSHAAQLIEKYEVDETGKRAAVFQTPYTHHV